MLVPHVRFALKKHFFLLPKYNIMSPWWPTGHIRVRVAHMAAQLGTNIFLDKNQKGARMGFESVTSWSSEALTTGLLLGFCCCVS
jgi:hypothetical protein